MWQQWLNLLLGLWLIALPFTMGLGTGVTWTLVITGAAVALLALWGALEHKGMEARYHRTA